MKDKKKKNVQPVAPVQQPVEQPTQEVVQEVKKYMVNCPKCGAALNVKEGSIAYMCPVCSNLFRMRKGEKMVKDISRRTVGEAYVHFNDRADAPSNVRINVEQLDD